MALFLGIDIGTSGIRAVAIDPEGKPQGQCAVPLPAPHRDGARVEQDPALWRRGLAELLRELLRRVPAQHIRAVAVDGTSGTVLLADERGEPLGPALMYNDARGRAEAQSIARAAPRQSAAHGPSAGLAKLLHLQGHGDAARARHVLNQADWIAGLLCGRYGVSDANNCLKLGHDPVEGCWPRWLARLGVRTDLLPEVVSPGTPVGTVSEAAAMEFGLAAGTTVVAGTTDSTAAFLATGAQRPGEAVTSLGSTLVLKVIAQQPVFAPEYGIYSQPLGGLWLAGGGSNTGGAVLKQHFTEAQMAAMTPRLRPDAPTGLAYYPLPAPGERFPVNDPLLAPHLEPRPADDVVFFQGLLEGMAHIELRGYRLLAELGAPYPVSVRSVGGGAQNAAWTAIRRRLLQVPMVSAAHQEAAYGAALLARRGAGAV